MRGFQTKYYLCEAERGDFVGNRQDTTLHTRKTWQVPLRHNSHQADRKLICEDVEVRPVWVACKGGYGVKKGLQRKEKIRSGLVFSFGCTIGMGKWRDSTKIQFSLVC